MPRRPLTEEEKDIKRKNIAKARSIVEANRIKKKEKAVLKEIYPSSSESLSESETDEEKEEIIKFSNPGDAPVIERFNKDLKMVKRKEIEYLREELDNVRKMVESKKSKNAKAVNRKPRIKKVEEKKPEQEVKPEPEVKPLTVEDPPPLRPPPPRPPTPPLPRQSLDEVRLGNILKKSSSNSSLSKLSKEDRVTQLLNKLKFK